MSQTLEEFKAKIETIYKPLHGRTFRGHISKRNSQAVCTGGLRYVVNVNSRDVCQLMESINGEITKASKKMYVLKGRV